MTQIVPTRPLRVAALVKQIPKIEQMKLGDDGRLQREGLQMHMNDYCRRAVAKGCEIAQASGGSLTVITLGPPVAENVLREAIAYGADQGVHVTDPAFAGSDTWATAKALARALAKMGPFDLILMGRNSLDADTGQVPPAVAQMLDLPFCTGVRELSLEGEQLRLRLEHDDERVDAAVTLPAVLSCAERLCDPCKIKDPAVWATVDGAKIHRLTAADLGEGPWGQSASPTSVGKVRSVEVTRQRIVLDGALDQQVEKVMSLLRERGALDAGSAPAAAGVVPGPKGAKGGPVVAVLLEPGRPRVARELLGAAAQLAVPMGGLVVALGPQPGNAAQLGSWGADSVVAVDGSTVEEDVATAVLAWCRAVHPWAVLSPSTPWGREIAARVAAVLEAGVTGDAVGLHVRAGRLIADKPAFGGAMVAEILCSSAVQMATVRAGVLPLQQPRQANAAPVEHVRAASHSRLQVLGRRRDDDSEELASASFVIGVGQGVKPEDYPTLEPMKQSLGAVFCATRKVTDKGWMPRARQVGITGHSISPRLFISLASSGKFNHTVGVRCAQTVVAINSDPEAEIFKWADIGIVGDWKTVMTALTPALAAARR